MKMLEASSGRLERNGERSRSLSKGGRRAAVGRVDLKDQVWES